MIHFIVPYSWWCTFTWIIYFHIYNNLKYVLFPFYKWKQEKVILFQQLIRSNFLPLGVCLSWGAEAMTNSTAPWRIKHLTLRQHSWSRQYTLLFPELGCGHKLGAGNIHTFSLCFYFNKTLKSKMNSFRSFFY